MVVKKREEFRAKHRYLRDFARENRKEMTEAEHILWQRLRSRQLGGFKFRREYPIGNYIADFVCVEAKLVVELDGAFMPDRKATTKLVSIFLLCKPIASCDLKTLP